VAYGDLYTSPLNFDEDKPMFLGRNNRNVIIATTIASVKEKENNIFIETLVLPFFVSIVIQDGFSIRNIIVSIRNDITSETHDNLTGSLRLIILIYIYILY
jgi:hypothetical protein